MSRTNRIVTVLILMGAVATVLALKDRTQETVPDPAVLESQSAAAVAGAESTVLPRLMDLGAGKCIPCKMMAPILEELKKDFTGTFGVEFIDVWENPEAGDAYGVRIIPTQIFYDSGGQELFRHEGFFSREDILGKWRELGHEMQVEEP